MTTIVYKDYNTIEPAENLFLSVTDYDIGRPRWCEIKVEDDKVDAEIARLTAKGCKVTGIHPCKA